MTDKNMCEEIQIAVLSENELSDEQKKHIENCEECRTLLSQVQTMKDDLGSLSVPGIEKGQIADRVMETIKKQKLSSALPKFRIIHHLGTAAAVAVILVAALIIKNPTDTAKTDISYNDTSAKREISYAEFGVTTDETEESLEIEEAIPELSDTDASDDSLERVGQENAPVMMKSMRPKTQTQEENSDGVTYDTYNAPIQQEGVTDAQAEESAEQESEKVKLSYSYTAGSGGGSSQPSLFADTGEGWRIALPALPDGMVSAFDGIEFLFGEENFDYNINLANERLYEIFGKENVLTREVLSDCGCTSNAEFLIFVNDGIGYVETIE